MIFMSFRLSLKSLSTPCLWATNTIELYKGKQCIKQAAEIILF